jgi:hypothetical protein
MVDAPDHVEAMTEVEDPAEDEGEEPETTHHEISPRLGRRDGEDETLAKGEASPHDPTLPSSSTVGASGTPPAPSTVEPE